ncbi:MAG TPA: HAMP domain-containing sensor histidine kinase [Pirellulaceae bacterium]|nr:HAMP domain-containing sensor histidine kinase [Pirellulaceae bacterium]HMO90666.1 HAMP domain-containing sensor histidine kinase [Pirellulaceae bacterium]HMP67755.1 HAMP domain-containing sensor histidine kinase [Pirellulaceae bacterium]
MVLSRRRIRTQLYYGVTKLFVVVAVLSAAGFYSVLNYRTLTKSIRARSAELPHAAELSQRVSDLRATFSKSGSPASIGTSKENIFVAMGFAEAEFRMDLRDCSQALEDYRRVVLENVDSSNTFANTSVEDESIREIEKRLVEIHLLWRDSAWLQDPGVRAELSDRIDELQAEVSKLPGYLSDRVEEFSEQARSVYHSAMLICAGFSLTALVLISMLAWRFHRKIFQPLELLADASRRVANGDYEYRVSLKTQDEMEELAAALNAMTSNFQEIQVNLNEQVKQRTREVVRSEQLASVGFLAAGVAHEINNPLAAIAWSAESLEMRVNDILDPNSNYDDEQRKTEIDELKRYLRRIQDEAFRCKGITSALLDYSRSGDNSKSAYELGELIEGVIEMVAPLGKYKHKQVHFDRRETVSAIINPQEIKQVVLNLLTNALDSVEIGGNVWIELFEENDAAVIIVADDGCGLTDEVMRHLFEPFFTRRRDGQGTGLGLSITYRIVNEHGGEIQPSSAGVGMGSKFVVTLPLISYEVRKPIAA